MEVKVPENLQHTLTEGWKQKMMLEYFRVARAKTKKVRKTPKPKKVFAVDATIRSQQTLINRMTNWQRHQWSKAGYPKSKIADFVTLTKESRNAA